MLLYIINGLYLCVWSIFLIHCLQMKQLYPIFGYRRGTKIFWLMSFIFFNPLLSLIYLIFGVAIQPPKQMQQWKPKKIVPIIALTCTFIVILLFEIPHNNYESEAVVMINTSQKDSVKTDNPFLTSGLILELLIRKIISRPSVQIPVKII